MAKILIVDDAKFMRKILSDILIRDGHEIVGEAENAVEAVELYKRVKPDLVTLDIILPNVGKEDSMSALKKMLQINPQTKVVMVSAMGQQQFVTEYMQAGAMDFIVKPFQETNVEASVKRALRTE